MTNQYRWSSSWQQRTRRCLPFQSQDRRTCVRYPEPCLAAHCYWTRLITSNKLALLQPYLLKFRNISFQYWNQTWNIQKLVEKFWINIHEQLYWYWFLSYGKALNDKEHFIWLNYAIEYLFMCHMSYASKVRYFPSTEW